MGCIAADKLEYLPTESNNQDFPTRLVVELYPHLAHCVRLAVFTLQTVLVVVMNVRARLVSCSMRRRRFTILASLI